MTVEGDNAIALVSRQSFESRFHSMPCFSRRAEIRLCCSDIESLSKRRPTATDGNRKWTFRMPGHQSLPDFKSSRLY